MSVSMNDIALGSSVAQGAPLKVPKKLPPILDATITHWLKSRPAELISLVASLGSPLNVVWPHTVSANIGAMACPLKESGVTYKIFYGAKANKSKALVRAAVMAGSGVDVSSSYELADAMCCGAAGADICATGPAKTIDFLRQLMTCSCLIAIDSREELEDVIQLTDNGSAKAKILLRYRPDWCRKSRFGMSGRDIDHAIQQLQRHKGTVEFCGFHFHLASYDWQDRVRAISDLTAAVEMARGCGFITQIIDIGGGIPVRYVESGHFARFLKSDSDANYFSGKAPSSFYPYGGSDDAARWLTQLLRAPCAGYSSVAELLKENRLTLALEPGRSLVDQSAITAFRITRVKSLDDDQYAIFVEGSSFSACETWFASEFYVDPLWIPASSSTADEQVPVKAFIAGHSCLGDDVITHRLLQFDRCPRPGDLLVFANTAGYQMDLLENQFHRYPVPARLIADVSTVRSLNFSLDE